MFKRLMNLIFPTRVYLTELPRNPQTIMPPPCKPPRKEGEPYNCRTCGQEVWDEL